MRTRQTRIPDHDIERPITLAGGNNPGDTPARTTNAGEEHGLRILAILSLLMAFASISTDLYLPALSARRSCYPGETLADGHRAA